MVFAEGKSVATLEKIFERLMSDWFKRLEDAAIGPETGWPKVDRVLGAGFEFFAENPDYVRLIRREAIDAGARVGIDLAAVLRPMWDRSVAYFQAEMDQVDLQVAADEQRGFPLLCRPPA